MIKINLIHSAGQFDLTNVGGYDLGQLKFKIVGVAIVLMYVPDFFLVPMWEEERTALSDKVTAKQGQISKLKREVTKYQDMDKQISELKIQEENLGKKLIAVKQAISEKRNPASLLLYIAKHIPAELWIKELNITPEEMTIKGEALDYTSIGNFVNSLRSSVFIRDASIAGTSSAVRESDKRRIESFEVKFGIARFDQ